MSKAVAYIFLLLVLVFPVHAGLGSDGLTVVSGQWDVDDGQNVYSLENTKRSIAILEDDFHGGETVFQTNLKINDYKSRTAYIIFDYVDENNFKYVGARAGKDKLVVGSYEFGSFKDSTSQRYEIDPGYEYPMTITLKGSEVTIELPDVILKKNFPLPFTRTLGFATEGSDASFGSVLVITNETNKRARFANINEVGATTGTGLDYMVDIIKNDPGLDKNVPETDILEGVYHTNRANEILLRSIFETGVANDDTLTILDMRILDEHIYENYFESWRKHHGDDVNGYEYGYHLIQNDGAKTNIYGENAVDTVIDGIHHLGYGAANYEKTFNEDFNDNQQYSDLAYWLTGFLEEDLKQGRLRSDQTSDYGYTLISGESLAIDNYIYVMSKEGLGLLLLDKKYDTQDLHFNVDMETTIFAEKYGGFVVFDYFSPESFKYAGINPDSKSWSIGEYKNGEWITHASKKDVFTPRVVHQMNVHIADGVVTLNVNDYDIVAHTFSERIGSATGLGVYKSAMKFSDISYEGTEKESIFTKFWSIFS